MSLLLERERHLSLLDGWWAAAAAGRGSLVLVAGEAGGGKTSLVRQLAPYDDAWVGWCEPLVTPRPMGPLLDVALQVGDPLLRAVRAASDPYDAFGALLEALRQRRAPTLLVVEDAHWCDDSTAAMLQYLGRRIESVPVMVVVTFRPDEITERHPFRRALADLARQRGTVHRLDVEPLSADAVGVLVEGSGLATDEVMQMTDGNPFYVTEVIANGGKGLPPTVRDAVIGRLSDLNEDERLLVAGVSAEPRGLQSDLVRPWLGLSPDVATGPRLAGILLADGPVLRFHHDLARLAAYHSVPGWRRLQLHGDMVRLLEETGAADPARLAHHAIGAEAPDLVLLHAVRAGRDALEHGATGQAVSFLSAARGHASRLSEPDRVELLLVLADALVETAAVAEAWAVAREGLSVAERHGDPRVTEAARTEAARIRWRAGDPVGAKRELHLAVERLRPLGPSAELTRALRTAARHEMFARRRAPAVELAREAAAVARTVGSGHDVLQSRLVEGVTELVTGDPGPGIEILQSVRLAAIEVGDRRLAADALSMLGSGGGEARLYEAALGWLAEAADLARHRDQDYTLDYARAWQARILLEQGRWDESGEIASPLVKVESPITRLTALGVLARLRVRRGDPRPTEPLDDALAMSGLELQHRWPSICAAAELMWLTDDRSHVAALEAAYAQALETDSHWAQGETGFWMWRLGLVDEPPRLAAEPFRLQIEGEWRAAAEQWDQLRCPYEQALALADGEPDDIAAALAILDRLGARPVASLLRSKLREHGAPVPRGPRPATRAHPAGLTAREVEVHDLVVDGLSNSDIAARLHLSRRTVEHHVSSVLAKCGVTARSEARAKVGVGMPIWVLHTDVPAVLRS